LETDTARTELYRRLRDLRFQESFGNYFDSLLGEVKNKRVLEYGCGDCRYLSLRLALLGAKVVTVDISGESVSKTYRVIKNYLLLSRVKPMRVDCEVLCFADASFDLVVGRAILHHLDLERALPELRRVLKPGGKALFIEPLGMNPWINLYRKLTPRQRSAGEHPLTYADLEKLGRYFSHISHREFNLLSLPFIFIASLVKGKKWLNRLLPMLTAADEYLFRRFPFLSRYCWTTVISLA
jgi:SAM-dependent methyltransferase